MTIPTVSEAVNLYLAYRTDTLGVAEDTQRATRYQLQRFVGWTIERHRRDILVSNLTTADYEGFHTWCSQPKPAWMENRKASGAAHLNKVRSTLRGFSRYCIEEGWCKSDGARRIKNRTAVPRQPLYLPIHDWPRILNAAEAMHPRDRAAVALGLYTFQRGGEIRTLRIADLDLAGRELVTVQHKTRGRDIMPLMDDCVDEMSRWLTYYREQMGGMLSQDMLLIPAKTSPAAWATKNPHTLTISQESVRLKPYAPLTNPEVIVQRTLSVLGYPTEREGFHTLRRSGARALFDTLAQERSQDSALEIVSAMLHHKNRSMTELYLGLEPGRRKRDQTIKGFRIGAAQDGGRDHAGM